MSDKDRRTFIKRAVALASALGLSSCAPGTDSAKGGSAAQVGSVTLDAAMLGALGRALLPVADLGGDGVERVVTGFQQWLDNFHPVAELNHGYLNRGLAQIRYGPPHPGPRWASQLEALELEARQRHGVSFVELSLPQQRSLIGRQIQQEARDRFPATARADHVAVGLMAYFYAGTEATDICYRAAIGKFTCRGLETAPDEPAPLARGA
ncbi:MAG: hypothetical protein ACE5HV_10530 [Acidobacteriota bacterium]